MPDFYIDFYITRACSISYKAMPEKIDFFGMLLKSRKRVGFFIRICPNSSCFDYNDMPL